VSGRGTEWAQSPGANHVASVMSFTPNEEAIAFNQALEQRFQGLRLPGSIIGNCALV
jgi:hypothetical protein